MQGFPKQGDELPAIPPIFIHRLNAEPPPATEDLEHKTTRREERGA